MPLPRNLKTETQATQGRVTVEGDRLVKRKDEEALAFRSPWGPEFRVSVSGLRGFGRLLEFYLHRFLSVSCTRKLKECTKHRPALPSTLNPNTVRAFTRSNTGSIGPCYGDLGGLYRCSCCVLTLNPEF